MHPSSSPWNGHCVANSSWSKKTAVFIWTSLQPLEPVNGELLVLVLCHTHELAFQDMPDVHVSTFYGSTLIGKDAEILRDYPHTVVTMPS
jgi:ATP-dependent RNA helicase UAP56/SUB2